MIGSLGYQPNQLANFPPSTISFGSFSSLLHSWLPYPWVRGRAPNRVSFKMVSRFFVVGKYSKSTPVILTKKNSSTISPIAPFPTFLFMLFIICFKLTGKIGDSSLEKKTTKFPSQGPSLLSSSWRAERWIHVGVLAGWVNLTVDGNQKSGGETPVDMVSLSHYL